MNSDSPSTPVEPPGGGSAAPTDTPPAEPAPADSAARSSAEASPSPSSTADQPAVAAPATDAKGPRRIGSQRYGQQPKVPKPKPQPVTGSTAKAPAAPPPQETKKYPAPNIRAQLPPELEVELAEALGGMSLEEIISGAPAEAVEAELEPETRVQGRVITVHRDNVFVDLGGRRQGILSARLFAEPPQADAVLDVVVARFDSAEGLYDLILPGGAVHVEDWSQVAEGMVVEAHVTGHNKGGLECAVNQLRGFIPASQISLYRVEDLAQFVDQKFTCVVTEANPDKRNLVLSRRAVLEREKDEARESLLAQMEIGQVREGTVRSLQGFGAFVDLGGVDGLIHISQLSWDRLKHASEALEIGQKVKVKIQKIDPATGKISLAFRDLLENPWSTVETKYPVRAKVKGTVSRLMDFGAFVRLEAGIEGLIHVSELAHKHVWRPSDVVSEGQEVEVQVLSVDAEQQRIGLSLRALEAKPMPAKKAEPELPEEPESPRPVAKPRQTPLKGGTGNSSGGEKFGLKW